MIRTLHHANRTRPPRTGIPSGAIWITAALLGTAGPLSAQNDAPLPLTRLNAPIVLDGIPDESAWDRVAPLPMTVYTPTFGNPPTEDTEIRVAYDDDYLYVSGRMFDSDPGGVRANTLYRDQYSGDDVFAIVLDSYNDNETAVWFSTNPAGVRSDRTVSNDAEFTGGFPMNQDWNTYWDVATAQDARGWFAEMRVPFSSIGFQDDNGRVVMGMIVYRFIARKNERQLFPAIPPNWGMGFAKPSQARRVVLDGVYAKKPVYLTPYALGGVNRSAELNGASTAYDFNSDVTNELGLDVKFQPTNNLTLDVTANTDFAQVEVDDQQVNLTRFSLFFPEKRQFFQERASVFEFNTGGFSRLFHSRRIGLISGEPIRILGGARMVGRTGGADIGVLNMQTASVSGRPAENFGVARVRQKVFNPYSTVGGILTTRVGEDGGHNVALGFDGVVRPFGDEYVTVKWARTFDDDASPGVGFTDASRFLARWERRNDIGFSYAADFIRSGTAYDPALGFAIRRDFTFGANQLQYQWFQGAGSPFRKISLINNMNTYVRNADRTAESGAIQPSVQIEMKSGAQLTVQVNNNYESVRDTFLVSGGPPVLPGDYWFHEAELRFMASRGGLFRGDFNLTTGSFFDGFRVSTGVTPTWSVSKHLELGANYQYDRIRFSERNHQLDAHLVGLKIQAALDVHLSVNTFVQYNNTDDAASINARIRYHFREGSDLWVVYNEGLNTSRNRLIGPRLPLTQDRAFLLKYTYTFAR